MGLLLTAVLAAAACAGDENDRSAVGDSETPPATQEPSAQPTGGSGQGSDGHAVRVWLERKAGLFPVMRTTDAFPALGRGAMEALLAGPSAEERSANVGTAVPEGTDLLGLSIEDGLATVDLSGQFEQGAGSLAVRLRVAQVVFTLTEFPAVDEVVFEIDGQPAGTFSSEGLVLDEPQSRRGYRDLLPPIVVYEPGIGDETTLPIAIGGTANVFEATVSIRLVVDGEVVVEDFTTATCGTGCRGSYEHELRFEVTEPSEAVLEVFESSAEDGSQLHVVRIPLELHPS